MFNKVIESNEEAKLMIKCKHYNEEDRYEEIFNIIVNKDNYDDDLNQDIFNEKK